MYKDNDVDRGTEKDEKKEGKHVTLDTGGRKTKGGAKDAISKVLKKVSTNVYGSINVKIGYDCTKVKTLPGDEFYEHKLEKEVEKKQEKWATKMHGAVEEAIERQVDSAKHALTMLELAWNGWSINSGVVLDVSFLFSLFNFDW